MRCLKSSIIDKKTLKHVVIIHITVLYFSIHLFIIHNLFLIYCDTQLLPVFVRGHLGLCLVSSEDLFY